MQEEGHVRASSKIARSPSVAPLKRLGMAACWVGLSRDIGCRGLLSGNLFLLHSANIIY